MWKATVSAKRKAKGGNESAMKKSRKKKSAKKAPKPVAKKKAAPASAKKAKSVNKPPTKSAPGKAASKKVDALALVGEVLPKNMSDKELDNLAQEHDERLVLAVKRMKDSVVEIGAELAIMKNADLKLWRRIKDPKTDGSFRGGFQHWQDYARFRLGGDLAQSSMYEYIAAASLTTGSNPIPKEDVQKMGVKAAAEVARLPERERTREVVEHAKKSSVKEVKKAVRKKIEDAKPEHERKVELFDFKLRLPQETIDLIRSVQRGGIFMEGIRDGDRTLPLVAKLTHAVYINFQANFTKELEEGEEFRASYERANAPVNDEEFYGEEKVAASKEDADQEDASFPSASDVESAFAAAAND